MRRIWVAGLVVLASAGAITMIVWRPTGGSAAHPPYRLETVDRGAITAGIRATGTLTPVTTVLVGSQLSGQVVEILVDFNSPVKAGQVVARLNAEQIKTRRDAALADLAQARADLGVRRAQLARSEATRRRAEANLRDQSAQRDRVAAQLAEAMRTLDRQIELSNRNVGSRIALDAARTQVEVQKASLTSSEAQIAAGEAELVGLDADIALADAQVRSAEAAILQREAKLREIEIDLARAEIRSPVDGVVVQRQIDLGQTVAASLSAPTLFTIAEDLRRIDIHANIDEADVGRLKPGQPASFTVSAYPNRTYAGTVRLVRLGAQTLQNVVTYTAVIGVDNRDLSLLPGMTANLQIVADERRDALRVPNAALRFRPAAGVPAGPGLAHEQRATLDPERRGMPGAVAAGTGPRTGAGRPDWATPGRVFMLGEDGTPKPVALLLGITDGSHTEVLSGDLSEGAAVIVGGGPRPQGAPAASAPASRPRGPRLF